MDTTHLKFVSDDHLDRRRLALDIADVVRSTPPSYSARIGVFGRWGTGKTTVLERLATYLKNRGYIVVRFTPATADSFQDLLGRFTDKLAQAFAGNGLYIEPRTKLFLRGLRGKLSSKTTVDMVEGAGEFHKGESWSMLAWERSPYGSAQPVNRLPSCARSYQKAGLVLIDDLDRCPARLLPQLLLSLRHVLDLERFTLCSRV